MSVWRPQCHLALLLWLFLVWRSRDANTWPILWEADTLTTKLTRHGTKISNVRILNCNLLDDSSIFFIIRCNVDDDVLESLYDKPEIKTKWRASLISCTMIIAS